MVDEKEQHFAVRPCHQHLDHGRDPCTRCTSQLAYYDEPVRRGTRRLWVFERRSSVCRQGLRESSAYIGHTGQESQVFSPSDGHDHVCRRRIVRSGRAKTCLGHVREQAHHHRQQTEQKAAEHSEQ